MKRTMNLLSSIAIREWKKCMRSSVEGAKPKYLPWDWLDDPQSWNEYMAKLRRHLIKWEHCKGVGKNGSYDEKGGFHHLAAVMSHAAVLMTLELLGIGHDPRNKKEK